MATTQLWKVDPAQNYQAVAVEEFTPGRPVLLYIGGDGDLKQQEVSTRLTQFVAGMLDPDSIATPMPGTAEKVEQAPDADIYMLTENGPGISKLADKILPEVPDTLDELKNTLSRFTTLTFSRGAMYVNGPYASLADGLLRKITSSGKFGPQQAMEALRCMASVQMAPNNLSDDNPLTPRDPPNQNHIPSIATYLTSDGVLASRFRQTRYTPYAIKDEEMIAGRYNTDTHRLVITARKPIYPSDMYSMAAENGRIVEQQRKAPDSHHPYLESNASGSIGIKGVMTTQVSPYAHILRHSLQKLVAASQEAVENGTARDAAGIISSINRDMLSPEAIKSIRDYLNDSMTLHRIRTDIGRN